MAYIGQVPDQFVIPVTKGADRVFSFRRREPGTGNPVDWDADVFVDVELVRDSPTRVTATVVADLATVRLDSTVCDQVRNSTRWRALMSESDSPSLETPIAVGKFERHDG